MKGKWVCPQCETYNEDTDTCVVCGVSYESVVKAYNVYEKKAEFKEKTTEGKTTEVKSEEMPVSSETHNVKFNWGSDDDIVPEAEHIEMPLSKKIVLVSVIAVVVGIILYAAPVFIIPIANIAVIVIIVKFYKGHIHVLGVVAAIIYTILSFALMLLLFS